MSRIVFSAIAMSFVAACGGGGGGGDGDALELTLSSSEIQWSQFDGKSRRLFIQAQVEGEVSEPVALIVNDDNGVISRVSISGEDKSYSAWIYTRPSISKGSHEGQFKIRLCNDAVCSKRYGQASIPYSVTVLSESGHDLRPLTPIAGVGDWSSYQRDSSRNGFLPISVTPEKFGARWLWDSGATTGPGAGFSQMISGSSLGLGFIHHRSLDGEYSLIAIRDSDGVEAWRVRTPASSWPTLEAGKLIVAGTATEAANLFVYAAGSGSLLLELEAPRPGGDAPGSPAVFNGKAIVNYGQSADTLARSGQILAFDLVSNRYLWSSATGGYANVAPAVDADNVYFYRPNSSFTHFFPDGFSAISADDGSSIFSVTRPADTTAQWYYNGGTPVIDGKGGVVVSAGAQFGFVDRYDLTTHALSWSVPAERTTPVVTGDIVYVGTNGGFEARALSNGALLWSWRPESHGVFADATYELAATYNIIFVATNAEVAAVDVVTRKTVWTYPAGSRISLSASGLLFITLAEEGKVTAVNLR